MKKAMVFVLFAALGAAAITVMALRWSKPHVLAFGSKEHYNKNFNLFPIDFPEREFDDWFS